MQYLQQENPCQPVVNHHRHQVIDRGDQGSGGHGRVHAHALERHGNNGTEQPGDHHGNHQGYVAQVKEFQLSKVSEMIKEKNGLIILLDGLEDVHNLGAIIRTAECAGVDGVIYKAHNAARLNDTVAKVASGALEYMKVAEVTNLVNTIKELKKKGYWIVGSAGQAQTMYNELDYDMNTVLVIGSEGKGMSRLVREQCDFIVKLPMYGHVSSLNASVAAGILIYNILDKRNK